MRKFLMFLLCLWLIKLQAEAPALLYLSLKGDPASTMTIQWQGSDKELMYQQEGEEAWHTLESASTQIVQRVELIDLEPDTTYFFRVGSDKQSYQFRTCPKTLDRPLRFVVGGDTYYNLQTFRKMNVQIAKTDPDFVVVGGDLAYVCSQKGSRGRAFEQARWETFLREWQRFMIAPDGRLIPMVVVVGNHDVLLGRQDGLFYELFTFPEERVPYRTLDFGEYFSLFLLDTGHTFPIEGAQTEWLEEALAQRAHIPLKMAAYHVGAYPAVYSYTGPVAAAVRAAWVPIFEKHEVRFAFEHHGHAYKRTHPIREGKVDPTGVIYLGDGAWGTPPRKINRDNPSWYLAKAISTNCFWLMTLSPEECTAQSFNLKGKLIEQIALPAMISAGEENEVD